jgi:hypothetical protein
VFYAVAAAALAIPLAGAGDYAVPRPSASPGSAVTAAAVGKSYGGHTRAGAPISLRVRGGRVTEIGLEARAPCDSKESFPVASVLVRGGKSGGPGLRGGKLSRAGRFNATSAGVSDLGTQVAVVRMAVTGKLGAKRSSGTVQVDVSVEDKATGQQVDHCAAAVRWAESVPERRVLSGSTAQASPVVLELSRDGKAVKRFWFGIFADCTPDGSIAPVDVIANFPIRHGRFGDDFSDEGPDGQGGTIHVDYGFHGRISRRAASGTIEVTATDRDAQGNTVATCPSGAIRWTARQ